MVLNNPGSKAALFRARNLVNRMVAASPPPPPPQSSSLIVAGAGNTELDRYP